MKVYEINITLEEDLIFSSRPGTIGGHTTLDYIPGAALLGACAARLYSSMSSRQSFQLFHTGKVRFGNGYPCSVMGEVAYPIPLSWHYPKGSPDKGVTSHHMRRSFIDNQCRDFSSSEQVAEADKKWQQLRSGYVTSSLEVVRPLLNLRMKTAIDPEHGRAATAQLFGYQSIAARQCFKARLAFDDEIETTLEEKVITMFNGTMLLGRSRSAQYGRVRCRAERLQTQPEEHGAGGTLHLWLLADTALYNNHGQPCSLEQLHLPGLEKAEIDWERTFVRHRAYSPYNAYRRKYDMERRVMEMGSIITLTGVQMNRLEPGMFDRLGAFTESGQGWLSLTVPDLAVVATAAAHQPVQQITVQETKKPENPNTLLINWLERHSKQRNNNRQVREEANRLAKDLTVLYANAAKMVGARGTEAIGPSASQWGRVSAAGAASLGDRQKLLHILFGALAKTEAPIAQQSSDNSGESDAVCKPGDRQWCCLSRHQDKEISFADWLRETLREPSLPQPGYVATVLARQAQSIVKQRQGGRVA